MRHISYLILIWFYFHLSLANADNNFLAKPNVLNFIDDMVERHQFKKENLLTLFSEVKVRPQVFKHIKKPLETNPWETYQMLFVNEWRIKHGVKFWIKHKAALERAEKIYGVPAELIIATIGIETKYGQRTGDYRVIDSLSNIAFSDSPRAPFFKKELEHFLLLTREEELNPLKVMGSYAGAMGQPQFMPSSYRRFAVNFSHSGKIDLLNNEEDVIGSVANYYHRHGFKYHEPIATEASMLEDHYPALIAKQNNKALKTIADFEKYGIHPKVKVKDSTSNVSLIKLSGQYQSEYWFAYRNFNVIKRYNPSDLYAMAVYQLSLYIQALKEKEQLNNV